jgi:hypothetical protein
VNPLINNYYKKKSKKNIRISPFFYQRHNMLEMLDYQWKTIQIFWKNDTIYGMTYLRIHAPPTKTIKFRH